MSDRNSPVVAVVRESNRLCVSCLEPCSVRVEVGTVSQRQSFHVCENCAHKLRVALEAAE